MGGGDGAEDLIQTPRLDAELVHLPPLGADDLADVRDNDPPVAGEDREARLARSPHPPAAEPSSTPETLARRDSSARTAFASARFRTVRQTALWYRDRDCSCAGVPSATTRPRLITTARVQTASTSSRMCVESTMHLVGAMAAMRVRTSCFWFGSRPSVGSSITSTSGSCMMAAASPTRRL